MKKTPLQVYLDTRDQALLERLATELGMSRAETVRTAIRRLAVDTPSGQDRLLDLIGAMDRPELPTDLSTRHDEYAVGGYPQRRVADRRPPRRKPR